MTSARSLLFFLASAVIGGALMAAVYGVDAGLATSGLLMVTSAPVLVGGHLVIGNRRRLGTLPRQFVFAVGLTITGSLVGLWLISRLLFVSAHDAFTMALLLGFAAALTAFCAWMLASRVRGDIEAVHDGLMAVGEGRRQPVPPTGANDETSQLAEAANRMIEQLVEREAERDAAQAMRHDLVVAMVDQLIERETERDASDEARRGLVVGVSHDTRTPLASLKLLASAIADEVVDAETQRRYAREILGHVDGFSALLDELFEFARLEAGDVEWTMERVAVDELVHETVRGVRAQAEAERLALVVDLPADLATVQASRGQVQRVLVNLLQNAIRHTPAAGTIRVAATATSSSVELEIADTGGGIQPIDRGRVFEPFFQGGSDASRNRPGAGLGLSICRLIVEAHGGRIWLEEAEHGTRIRFSLRRADLSGGSAELPPAPSGALA